MDGYYDENGPSNDQRELQIDLGMDRFNRRLPAGRTIEEMYDFYFEGVVFDFSEDVCSTGTGLSCESAGGYPYYNDYSSFMDTNVWLPGYKNVLDYGAGWVTEDESVDVIPSVSGEWFECVDFGGSDSSVAPGPNLDEAQVDPQGVTTKDVAGRDDE